MSERTPTTKQVQELRVGDAVVIPSRNDEVCEVRDVHIWRAPITAFRLDAAVFVVSLSTGAADTLSGRADQVLALATNEQRAAAVEEHVRRRVVAELQELAAFIERTKPRIVDYFDAPRVSIRLEGGEIERVAEAVGVGTTEYGSGARRAVWPGPDRVGVVSAEFVGAPAPVAPAVPAHHHVGGSSGGPGECSAECACGVTYSGFDTLAEAVAVLDLHIANPDGTGETTPADPVYRVEITDGTPFTTADGYQVSGYVAGLCGHRVAGSEWRAGLRTCERCPSWSGPVTVPAPATAEQITDAVLSSLRPYVNVDDWSPDVDIDLAAGTVKVTEEFSGDVIAQGTVTGPGVTAQAGE